MGEASEMTVTAPAMPTDGSWTSSLPGGQEQHVQDADPRSTHSALQLHPGASFVLHTPAVPEAVWGAGDAVLWARGESLMIVADSGVGKTTLAGLTLRGLLGLDAEVLELPVRPATGRVLYLAMDRPRQVARSLRRQFGPEDADVLDERLVVWKGPLPVDLVSDRAGIRRMARAAGASHVVIDSVKDAVIGLVDDTVAAAYNQARQAVLADGIELQELHHNRKQTAGTPRAVTSLSDVYGSTWLTAGVGSVVALNGDAGGPIVELRHLKQPAEDVGPLRIAVDRKAGTMTTTPTEDVFDCLAEAWRTPNEVAVLFLSVAKPSAAQLQRVRRALNKLVEQGRADVGEPVPSGNGRSTDRYRLAQHGIQHAPARGPRGGA